MESNLKLKIDKRVIIYTSLWIILSALIISLIVLSSKYFRIDWVQNRGFDTVLEYGNVKDVYLTKSNGTGGIRVYALTMTLGMIVAIGFSLYNFNKKDLSVSELAIGVIFIIPCSLFGASFFGKLNAEGIGRHANGSTFWGLFAFWEGGMAIHGGVYVGSIVGLLIFYIIGRKTKVSLLVYADCIIPNILLGQAIGRWGNFFNHEVLGTPVAKIANSIPSHSDKAIDQIFSTYLQTHSRPLFLPGFILKNCLSIYSGENQVINNISLENGNVVLLSPIFFYESIALLLGWFVIMFIIPNVWKLFIKPIDKNNNVYKIDHKFSFYQFFNPWLKSTETKLSSKDAWKKTLNENVYDNASQTYINLTNNIDSKDYLEKKLVKNYVLNKLNNKNNYPITKAGVQMFSYFLVWSIVRYVLEAQRPNDHLFIMHYKNFSLFVIGLSAIVGLIGMILSQHFLPSVFRKPGWLYEVEYFKVRKIN
ncbi:prolipoprotein diacylglyceryl transferase [Mycoplasma capricolum subsp. capripneumoniae]|uniref:Prolipoprotein diacylglyceryl transferase n=1 Tax=Mycoplasma capricolum subsp. capripneumoniae 87001 TaxID=1124992 RepID=A0A9N7AYM8_MYCCC|nr:prolipoprotein diacylglyceryl transferase family protein [Mycoplasma capricolum]AJK51809.1 prolipoprotein diacylglyceryl transferase [Mycoplasma capricolum subsp. capripneumoniae 87001]KEY84749.1 Prolipoprotein diacyl-glyceryl transferase [Mycoplasma capricolum subsp. capripneumoniae 99108]QDL19871.1 diacylglyceryl transferase [Mycoplasma capricolum subsp. capripneumoniae]QDL20556.1 diacylglyceryl transferase [Mycoplasma capricolum subsp. capripneumoniae]QDL21244.1 diacylglyceryl transferas